VLVKEGSAVLPQQGGLLVDGAECSFGRLGHWFGEGITGVVPDMVTSAKGKQVLDNVQALDPRLWESLHSLKAAHRCVKDVRGTGFFYAVELHG
jgi:4-aminobutyrate aminotransferase-like enzyme